MINAPPKDSFVKSLLTLFVYLYQFFYARMALGNFLYGATTYHVSMWYVLHFNVSCSFHAFEFVYYRTYYGDLASYVLLAI